MDFITFYKVCDICGNATTSMSSVLTVFIVPFISTQGKFLFRFKIGFLETENYWLYIVCVALNVGEMFEKAINIPLNYLIHV